MACFTKFNNCYLHLMGPGFVESVPAFLQLSTWKKILLLL